MTKVRETTRGVLEALPVPARQAAVGAGLLGATGGVVGLALGLRAHPATAWAAVLELGVPGLLLGAVLGLLAGLVAGRVRGTASSREAKGAEDGSRLGAG